MSRPRKYPEELLERGVRLVLDSGRPIAHVAADLGIHPETLHKHVRSSPADYPDVEEQAWHRVVSNLGAPLKPPDGPW